MKQERYEWLDFFRGSAAIAVVLYHLHLGFDLPATSFGYLAVDLFFVLSGIVLGIRYAVPITEGMPFVEFAWHRLRRLYPMAFLTALLVLAMDLAGIPNGVYAWASNSMPAFLSLLFLTPLPLHFGETDAFPAGSPTWSLWAELVSNVVWFAALRLGARFTQILFAASFILAFAFAWHQGTYDYGVRGGGLAAFMALTRALAWFGVGYFIALQRPRLKAPTWVFLVVFAAAIAFYELAPVNGALSGVLVVLTGTMLLVSLMAIEPRSPSVSRICAYLGMLSFPLYLVHVPGDRLAIWLVANGWSKVPAHALVICTLAVLATVANEMIVRRLPKGLGAVRTLFAR